MTETRAEQEGVELIYKLAQLAMSGKMFLGIQYKQAGAPEWLGEWHGVDSDGVDQELYQTGPSIGAVIRNLFYRAENNGPLEMRQVRPDEVIAEDTPEQDWEHPENEGSPL